MGSTVGPRGKRTLLTHPCVLPDTGEGLVVFCPLLFETAAEIKQGFNCPLTTCAAVMLQSLWCLLHLGHRGGTNWPPRMAASAVQIQF